MLVDDLADGGLFRLQLWWSRSDRHCFRTRTDLQLENHLQILPYCNRQVLLLHRRESCCLHGHGVVTDSYRGERIGATGPAVCLKNDALVRIQQGDLSIGDRCTSRVLHRSRNGTFIHLSHGQRGASKKEAEHDKDCDAGQREPTLKHRLQSHTGNPAFFRMTKSLIQRGDRLRGYWN